MMSTIPKHIFPFTPKSIFINGHSLSYLDEGEGNVLVMLHGNPTWSFYFRNLVSLLKDRYRVIVLDHLGCGLSDKPQNYSYTLENHIDNLETFLDKLEIESYSLVLHDWGGAIGMGVAVRHPYQIESLIILNSAAFRSKRLPFRIRICRWPFIGAFLVRGLNGFARAALCMAVKQKMPKAVAEGYLAPYETWDYRIALHRFVEDIPLSAGHPSWDTLVTIEKGLEKFTNTPMLILWGGRDFCFTREFYDEWRRRFPVAEGVFFADAGHYVLEDAFNEIAPILTGFLEKHEL